jgi:branched-subunit amino acid ABC-type transport system permease component
MCLFALSAGSWLSVMEIIMKHDGYQRRLVVAICIVLQGLATFLFLLASELSLLRRIAMVGALAILWLGGSAIWKVLRAQHFEGFVFLIGLALILQGAMTLVTLRRKPDGWGA